MRVLLFETSQPEPPRRWALRAADIVALLPVVRWRPIEGGPPWALGVFECHGALMPLIDLPRLLGDEATKPCIGARIALVKVNASASESVNTQRGAVGFLLSNTLGLAEIDFAAANAYPGFDSAGRTPLGPIARTEAGYVQLVEPDRAFGNVEREALRDVCNEEDAQ